MADGELTKFKCPACGAGLAMPAKVAGRKVRCPKCSIALRVWADMGGIDFYDPEDAKKVAARKEAAKAKRAAQPDGLAPPAGSKPTPPAAPAAPSPAPSEAPANDDPLAALAGASEADADPLAELAASSPDADDPLAALAGAAGGETAAAPAAARARPGARAAAASPRRSAGAAARRGEPQPKKSNTALIIGGVAGVALLLAAAVIGYVVLGGGSGAIGAAMAYLPDEPDAVFSVDFEAVTDSAFYQSIMDKVPTAKAALAQVEQESGMALSDYATMVIGVKVGERPHVSGLITLTRDVDFAALDAMKKPDVTQEKAGDYTLFVNRDLGIVQLDPRTLVFGTTDDVRDVLKRGRDATISSDLRTLIGRADFSRPFALAMTMGGVTGRNMPLPPGGPIDPAMIDQITGITLSGTVASALDLRASVLFKSTEQAENTAKMIDGLLAGMKSQPGAPPDVKKMLDSAKVEHSGDEVSATVTLEVDPIITMLGASVGRAQDVAGRQATAANLTSLHKAMYTWSLSNQDRFPPDLGTLYQQDMISPKKVLRGDSSTVPPDTSAMTKDEVAAWINANTDFVYLADRASATTAADEVIAYERIGDERREGINVLYGDGHVEFHPIDEAKQLLQDKGVTPE